MTTSKTWDIVEKNCQRVAEENELVTDGAIFTLTDDQQKAIEEVRHKLKQGDRRILLKAPTGSGKTEVFMRVSIAQVLDSGGHVVVVVPTRDLARQQANYLEERVANTDLDVVQMHAGIPPRTRRAQMSEVGRGSVRFVVGSALLMQNRSYRQLLETCSLLVVDDVNAFDEDEDLVHLRGLRCQILYVTATPEAVGRFLRSEGAMDNVVEIKQMPFDSPPTVVHEVRGEWNENMFTQIDRGMPVLKQHIDAGSRVYIISRTRSRVPIMATYVEDRLGVPVSILHGEMADSVEHRKRLRKGKGILEDRVSMMKQFRENSPAVLVATNLVGSGLDVPMADMVLVTDADHFGEAEIEQLLGRVGRRATPSDAVLVRGTSGSAPRGMMVKGFTRIRKGKVVQTFRMMPQSRRGRPSRRLV